MTNTQTTVTPAQVKYIHLLHERGPMTVNELASNIGKSIQYAHGIVRELREEGIIEKTFEGIDTTTDRHISWRYKLCVPIESINIKARRTLPHRITDEEILYAAILKNSDMKGQKLYNQFRVVYPHRPRGSIVNIIRRARQRGWI